MTSKIDEICPADVGAIKIKLSKADPEIALVAGVPFELVVDYSQVGGVGVSLPIEVVIQGPNPGQYKRRLFRRIAPSILTLKPFSGGRHFVHIREMFHNRWQGQLFVEVNGADPTNNLRDR